MAEKRLIDANALSKSIKDGSGTELQKFFADICVATAPTVDAVEVVHAKWVYKCGEFVCSHCDGDIPQKVNFCRGCYMDTDDVFSNFCPNCGADMRGESDGR